MRLTSSISTTDDSNYEPDFNVNLQDNIRPWLNLIDELRDIGIGYDDVSLPQIVVMGDQSSGKSSVLEALSGIEFPRGSGIVTRCPTEVKMKRASEWRGTIKLTGENSGDSEDLKSPNEISRRIEELTQKLTCSEKAIETNRSIQIEVFSPDVLDLTVIDLPGIVRWKMDGQSETVVQDVDSLLQRYLVQPRTVILAVIPSNVDIATVDIIERASKVDPGFRRTIGVFTKPDMMDSGHLKEKVQILEGNESSIRLSCTMLKNRGPEEIAAGVSLAQAKKIEADYFNTHAKFKTMEQSLFGIDHFSQKLSVVLAQRIKESLPDLEREIMTKSHATEEELARLGDAPPSDKKSRLALIKDLLKSVTADIHNAGEGLYTSEVLCKQPQARIFANFKTLADDCKNKIMQGMPQWDVDDVQKRTAAMRGRELHGFLSFSVFSIFVQEMVLSWKTPVMELLDSTTELITQSCHIIIGHHAQNSEAVKYDLEKSVDDAVAMKHKEAKISDRLKDLFESELKPNTVNALFMKLQNEEKMNQFKDFITWAFQNFCGEHNHPDRWEIQKSIIKDFNEVFTLGSESNDKKEAELLKGTLEAYWKTKAAPFVDRAIRAIDRLLLEDLHNEIEKEFYSRANEDDFSHYFYEPPYVEMKRKNLQKSIDRLAAAKKKFKCMSFAH